MRRVRSLKALHMLPVLLSIAALVAASGAGSDDPSLAVHGRPVTDTLRSDMTTAHEARPHGVPEYWDWAKKPRIGRREAPTGWTAFTAWVRYRCAGSPYDRRRTVQVRDLQAWFLVGDHWKLAQRPSALEGLVFAEDYARPAVSGRVVGELPRTHGPSAPRLQLPLLAGHRSRRVRREEGRRGRRLWRAPGSRAEEPVKGASRSASVPITGGRCGLPPPARRTPWMPGSAGSSASPNAGARSA